MIRPELEKVTEEFVTEYAELVDWKFVSKEINIKETSIEFFERFKDNIDWVLISGNKTIYTEFAHRFVREIGYRAWYNEKGELHREGDLPAVIYDNGHKEWWVNGYCKYFL